MMVASAVLAEGSFTDPQNARTIYLMAAGLVLVAVALTVGTVVWWRAAKSEHPVLGPLEVMGTRRWRSSDFATRGMLVEDARPFPDDAVPEVEPVDLDALVTATPPQFDDLAEPAVDSPAAESAAEDSPVAESPAEESPDEASSVVESLAAAEESPAQELPAEESPVVVEVETVVEPAVATVSDSIDPLLRSNAAD